MSKLKSNGCANNGKMYGGSTHVHDCNDNISPLSCYIKHPPLAKDIWNGYDDDDPFADPNDEDVLCKYNSLKRMIFWSDHPLGDIGVSFVDPIAAYSDYNGLDGSAFMPGQGTPFTHTDRCDFLKDLFENEKVLDVASNSEDELGRSLAAENIKPFNGYMQHWMFAFDKNKNHRVDDVMLYWDIPISSKDQETYDDFSWLGIAHNYDKVINTFTNCPFNYLYIKKVLSNRELVEGLKQYDFFTDGEIVDTRFGYYSPAYAMALLKSLQRHSLCSVLRYFDTFRRYEPIDPITSLCKRIALEKYKGVSFGCEVNKARNAAHDYSMLDMMIECEDDEREAREYDRECLDNNDELEPYYVDGVPVYGADDQEDADIQYWNTH